MKNSVLLSVIITILTLNTTLYSQNKIDLKVDSVLKLMTLREKIGQLNQYSDFFDVTGPAPKSGSNKEKYEQIKSGIVGSMLNVRGVKKVRKMQELAVENSRLGIPMIFGFDVIHGYSTIFPIPLAEAASWDLEAIKNSAAHAAEESSAAGINWTFAPMMDISRDARWGRVMEGSGEDPYLGAQIAKARVIGFQGDDLKKSNTIAACAKHFAGYGFAEAGRDYNTADFGNSTLYNIVLPPFKAAVEAGVETFMTSFNEINGIPSTGNKFLLKDILKNKWKFDGFVVSDWGSIIEMNDHGFTSDDKEATIKAINAGCDMDMESNLYVNQLEKLVKDGTIKESQIDDATKRILRVKFKLGLFDDPYKYCDSINEQEEILAKKHQMAALDMAEKSIVLLKNENNILPLKKAGLKIALIGQLAASKNSPLGSWRLAGEDNSAISVLEGLKNNSENNIKYEEGIKLYDGVEHFIYELKINNKDTSGLYNAVKLASKSDVVIMVLGEHGFQSGEGRSRTKIGLPGFQLKLLKEVFKVNKNIVLVLENGRPLAIPWEAENIPAILETWHLGSQAGNAVANVLFGDYNPSGKLPLSFPRSIGQLPIYYNHKNTGRPGPKNVVFWSHYIDESNDPLFPFGYGLSYTNFEISDLNMKNDSSDLKIEVSVKVENTGSFEGEEVIQLYIRDMAASITRPVKELKGFKKIKLEPGMKTKVSFTLDYKKLGFYNNNGDYVVEPGDFEIMVGNSSVNTLNGKIKVGERQIKNYLKN